MTIHEAGPDELARLGRSDGRGRRAATSTSRGPGASSAPGSAGGRAILVFDDGFRLLSLERPWRLVGGSGAYLSRGPVVGRGAGRAHGRSGSSRRPTTSPGAASTSSRATPRSRPRPAYGALIRGGRLPPDRGGPAVAPPGGPRPASRGSPRRPSSGASRPSVRQRVRHAERSGLRAVRWDVRHAGDPGPGFESPPPTRGPAARRPRRVGRPGVRPVLRPARSRRPPGVGSGSGRGPASSTGRAPASRRATSSTSRSAARTTSSSAAATFYRHGGRLTYSHSGDRVDLRHTYPGVIHLLLWRAIQLAIRDGLGEMDLAGRRRARSPPRAGRGRGDVRAVCVQALVRGALGRADREPRAGHPTVALRAGPGDREAARRR